MYREQVSRWRSRARRPETVMARVPEPPPEDPAAGLDARLALRDALRTLPPGKRAVLALRYLENPAHRARRALVGCWDSPRPHASS
jgi:DNA-directed RNA polymerase specialized sigma24 family protein